VTTNNSNTDTHIYNIINNPPKEFTEPCECCGVSEFQLGVKHAEERIIKLLESIEGAYYEEDGAWSLKDGINLAIELIKGENK